MAHTDLQGTCPACFRTVSLVSMDEASVRAGNLPYRIAKHGWKEQGGREVGKYGQAWHTGSCFGVGWAPFELSPKGTLAFVEEVLYPHSLALRNEAQRLLTMPELIETYTAKAYELREDGYRTGKPIDAPWQARFVSGCPESETRAELTSYHSYTITLPSYDALWNARVNANTAQLGDVNAEGGILLTRVKLWAKENLTPKAGPVMHCVAEFLGTRAARAACGSRSFGLMATRDEGKVTCTRCLASLESSRAATAAVEAEKADAAALVAWLATKPQRTGIAAIKSALGWDTKRANKAIERCRRDRTVQVHYETTPVSYRLREV